MFKPTYLKVVISGQWIIIQNVHPSSIVDVDFLRVDDEHSVGREFWAVISSSVLIYIKPVTVDFDQPREIL